jgi:hypothetical protein
MTDRLESLAGSVPSAAQKSPPPLERWHPPLSGDIDIRIAADGSWYHEGGRIRRAPLVALFASILRREDDGDYYLVTPVEKWRIQVELHPLVVTEINRRDDTLYARLNTGTEVAIGADNALFLEPALDDVAAIHLPHGLSAVLTRAAWYRLVESAEARDGRLQVHSAGVWFPLQ